MEEIRTTTRDERTVRMSRPFRDAGGNLLGQATLTRKLVDDELDTESVAIEIQGRTVTIPVSLLRPLAETLSALADQDEAGR